MTRALALALATSALRCDGFRHVFEANNILLSPSVVAKLFTTGCTERWVYRALAFRAVMHN